MLLARGADATLAGPGTGAAAAAAGALEAASLAAVEAAWACATTGAARGAPRIAATRARAPNRFNPNLPNIFIMFPLNLP